jgi:hypothetical protein
MSPKYKRAKTMDFKISSGLLGEKAIWLQRKLILKEKPGVTSRKKDKTNLKKCLSSVSEQEQHHQMKTAKRLRKKL